MLWTDAVAVDLLMCMQMLHVLLTDVVAVVAVYGDAACVVDRCCCCRSADVYAEAACVVDRCCCCRSADVYADAACAVDRCCCCRSADVHVDAAWFVGRCCCCSPCIAAHLCVYFILRLKILTLFG